MESFYFQAESDMIGSEYLSCGEKIVYNISETDITKAARRQL